MRVRVSSPRQYIYPGRSLFGCMDTRSGAVTEAGSITRLNSKKLEYKQDV